MVEHMNHRVVIRLMLALLFSVIGSLMIPEPLRTLRISIACGMFMVAGNNIGEAKRLFRGQS